MRSAARLFSVEFDVALADQDSDAIRQALETQFDLALVCSGEHFLVSNLVNAAIEGMGFANLKKALESNAIQEMDLNRLLQYLNQQAGQVTYWNEMAQAERAGGLPVFDDPLRFDAIGNSNMPFVLPATSRDKLNYLEFMQRVEDIDTADIDLAIKLVQQLELDHKHASEKAGILGMRDMMITNLITPAFTASFTAFVRTENDQKMAKLALGIRLYQAKHGNLPDRLEQLKEFGLDSSTIMPPGGKPFGYLRTGTTSKLWGNPNWSQPFDPVSDLPPELVPDMDEFKKEQVRQTYWEFAQ
jgi:hypothetical protein